MPPVPLSLIAPLLLAALPSVAAQGQERKLYQGKPLGHWIRQLKIGKWFEREQALKAIREAGPDARGHVTDLIRAVNKPRLRLLAIEALGAIGPLAKKAVSKVREHRRSGNPALRDAAMRALDRLGADVIRLLIADLGTRKFSGDAIQRLARFGERAKPAVRKLARIITYKPRLSMVGVRDKRAIDQYRRERARADRNRMLALNAIVAIGPEAARDALPAVAQAMKHSDPKIAELAIRVLGIFGEDAIPGYSLAFRDKTHPHRRMFIEAWQAFGPASRRVLPLLQKIAMSRSSMKRQASDAILAIRTATEQLSRVGDNDPDLRLEAALALCSYGRSAMEGIVQGLRDPVAENRRALLERILELGKLLAPGRAGGRSASWPPMPPLPRAEFVPLLEELLRDEDDRIVDLSCRILADIGERHARRAIPRLAELLEAGSIERRLAALHCLTRIPARGARVAEAYCKGLRSLREDFRAELCAALVDLGKSAVGELVKTLKGELPHERVAAAEILGKLGVAASAAIPALTEAQRDESEVVRNAATAALKKIH